jgi:SdrD B-like domain
MYSSFPLNRSFRLFLSDMKVLREFFVMLWLVTKTAMAQPPIPPDIGDFVWEDSNRNGIQDAGEPGIPGVLVRLLQGESTLQTTITSPGGFYGFTNLSPGEYQVVFVLAATFDAFTSQNQGADTALDSDVDSSGTTGIINFSAGVKDLTQDAGMVRLDKPPTPKPSSRPSLQPAPTPACPCEHDWKSHNDYVNCVKKDAKQRARLGIISKEEADALVSAARATDCGKVDLCTP